jgi:catalase
MQSVLGGAMQTAADAVTATGALSSDSKKIVDIKKDFIQQTDKDRITSEFGVKQSNTDNWLSASTSERKGPALLEDNFAREKVC